MTNRKQKAKSKSEGIVVHASFSKILPNEIAMKLFILQFLKTYLSHKFNIKLYCYIAGQTVVFV